MNRSLAREETFKLLYSLEIQKENSKEQTKIYLENAEISDEKTQAIVESIIRKDNEIFRLKDELNAAVYKKVCPNCNSNISKTAVYCSSCGAKMDVEE